MSTTVISPGTKVRTTQADPATTDWNQEALAKRKWGVEGEILTHHNAHGPFYEVRHQDGTFGCYVASEFEIIG